MATYYLDLENGNDANDGLSFANRWKTFTNGATAARIAPGDTIRVMASPTPTTVGNGTWTGGGFLPAVNIASSTNATPIVVTTSTDHGMVAGDYVAINGHTTNTNANGVWKVGTVTSTTFQLLQMNGTNVAGNGVGGATGTARKVTNCIVKLASPVNANIALCGGLGQKPAWTASTNVTATQNTTTWVEGNSCAQIAIAAAFTTGKAAYYTLPASLNLSAYQQVSFWVRQTAGTIGAAGAVYLALCTDTVGNTVAHTVNIPSLAASNRWVPITVDLGTNLNAAIQSVAFYVATDNGAQTFSIDNIVACKASSSADSVNIKSLVSKKLDTDDEGWFAIQAINYDTLQLAGGDGQTPLSTQPASAATTKGYNGTTQTVTTYKRETIQTPLATANTSTVSAINEGGTLGSPIIFSGGWDRTNMSTQTGYTWVDGTNGLGRGIHASGTPYVTYEKFGFCRYNTGIYTIGAGATDLIGQTFNDLYFTTCAANGISDNSYYPTAGTLIANNCGTVNIDLGVVPTVTKLVSEGATQSAVNIFGGSVGTIIAGNSARGGLACVNVSDVYVGSLTVTNCVNEASLGQAVSGNAATVIAGGSSSGNGGFISSPGPIIRNFTVGDAVVFGPFAATSYALPVYFPRLGNTDGNNWQYSYMGTVNQQTSVVDSPATTAWKLAPTSARNSAIAPLRFKVATVACAANAAVTVTLRMRRDNTGLTMRLICPEGQLAGIGSTAYTDMTAAADTWETVSLSFTPTKAGGVDIYVYAFGGTTYSGYVCNFTASQA